MWGWSLGLPGHNGHNTGCRRPLEKISAQETTHPIYDLQTVFLNPFTQSFPGVALNE